MSRPPIYYIRHGQTDWNAQLRFQGQRDIELNDHGREQARRNGRALKQHLEAAERFRFISSPMARTRETMEIIRAELGLPVSGYETDDRLIEASYGDWEGTTLPEMKQNHPLEHRRRKQERWTFCPPNGESHADILGRVSEWHDAVEDAAIVVAHGVVGRVLRKHVLGLGGQEAADYVFPQDKVFRFENGGEVLL